MSLREVARRADVSHGAPAHYFKNKAGLLSSFAGNGLLELKDAFLRSIRERNARTGKEKMMAIGLAYVAYAAAHPGWFDVMVRRDLVDKTTHDYLEGTKASFGVLSETVNDCVREGLVEPKDAQAFAQLCWSVVFGLSALWTCGAIEDRMGRADIDAVARETIELYIRHIMPEDAPAPAGPPVSAS